MANGPGNFGFNIGGGGGGIANLVQAPKVTPVRSVQFAPTPQRRVQRDEKDPKKQILGALLGASSPFLAEAGLAGLAKIPGLEDKLFRTAPETRQELGIQDSEFGRSAADTAPKPDPVTGRSSGFDAIERERGRLRERIDAAIPITDKMLPQQKTFLGKGLRELLTYAPAFALGDEDDGGVAAFISAAQAGKKLEGATDEARLENYLKRVTERDKALTKDLNLTRKISYGAVQLEDGQVLPVTRDVLLSKDGSQKYVVSQGDKRVDSYVNEKGATVVIPAGQAYFNNNLALDDDDIPNATQSNYYNANDLSQQAIGRFYSAVMRPDGTRGPLTVIEDPNGGPAKTLEQWKAEGANWLLDTRGREGLPLAGRKKTQLTDLFDEADLKYNALNGTLNASNVVLQIAKEAVDTGDPQTFTTSGKFLNKFASSLNNEINSIDKFVSQNLGGSTEDIIRGRLAQQNSGNVMRLFGAANLYSSAFANYTGGSKTREQDAAENRLIAAISALEQSTSGQITHSLTKEAFSFGNKKEITDNVVQRGRLIAAQLRLAYAAAASEGQTGRTLSDKDVANFLEQVGYESTNPFDVGTRTAEFVGELFNKYDNATPTLSDLTRFSQSANPSDINKFDSRFSDLFGVSTKGLGELRQRDANGDFVLSDEDAAARSAEIFSIVSDKSIKARPYFYFDPRDRRFKFLSFKDRFRQAVGSDPRAKAFLEPGGYFDTFGIITEGNEFIYDFSGRMSRTPSNILRSDENDQSGGKAL